MPVNASANATQASPSPSGTASFAQKVQQWSGRMSLKIENPPQSFFANFELRGNAQAGELLLISPIGTSLGQLTWNPQQAILRSGKDTHEYPSLDALTTATMGTALPVPALFDWLNGIATPVPGWRTDFSELAKGRLNAQRDQPAPVAQLRVILDN